MTFSHLADFCNASNTLLQIATYLIKKGDNLCLDDSDCQHFDGGSKCVPIPQRPKAVGRCESQYSSALKRHFREMDSQLRSIYRDTFGKFYSNGDELRRGN